MLCQVVTKASCPQHPAWVPGWAGSNDAAPGEPRGWGHVQHPHRHPLGMGCELERAPPGTRAL